MGNIRKQTTLLASLALLALLGACKGDSPTAPPTTTGGPITPPTSAATITLAVSNPSPVTNSSSTITATVTVGGQPAPNGTAVEFTSSTIGAVFTDTGTESTVRTTLNGQASVVLTAVNAGTVTVTAFVGGSSARTNVVFRVPDTQEPTQPTTPQITSITPTGGRPQGGENVTINGRNLRGPVRVQFDFGNNVVREATIVSSNESTIRVLAPPIELGTGQTRNAIIRVITQFGSVSEQAVVAPTPYVYAAEVLTPHLVSLSPGVGNPEGGQRVTLFGDGFQSLAQVFFGRGGIWHPVSVVGITFNEIIIMTPDSRAISPTGNIPLAGPVDVRVLNVNSGTEAILTDGFRYTPDIAITTFRPLQGPSTGGTDITIDGIGFQDPLQVLIGGVEAQVNRVSGSQLLVRTRNTGAPCDTIRGEISIRNTSTGATTVSDVQFTYIGVPATITSITGTPVNPGGSITVVVNNPGVGPLGNATIRFRVNNVNVLPTPNVITQGTGPVTFTLPIPLTGFNFPSETCVASGGSPGVRSGPLDVDLEFLNVTTDCTDSIDDAVRIVLPDPQNPCLTPPNPIVTQPAAGCSIPPNTTVAGAPTQSTITISNAPDAETLNITSVAISGTNASEFTIAPTSATNITRGTSRNFTLTFDPTSAGGKSANVTFTTNSTTRPTVTVCVTATADP
jgi:hypothetical protein